MKLNIIIAMSILLTSIAGCASHERLVDTTSSSLREPVHADELLTWVDQELSPYITEQFQQHPWLRNKSFAIVAMEGEDILPQINQVTEEIRVNLAQRLRRAHGVRMIWRPVQKPWKHHRSIKDVVRDAQCIDLNPIEVFVGIETRRLMTGELQITVNAVDSRQRQWIPNFGLDWRGRVSSDVLAALNNSHVDERLRGLRPLPFAENEPDLLASYLATNLSCLFAMGMDDYSNMLVFVDRDELSSSTGVTASAFSLLDNYLNKMNGVQITDNRHQATVIMEREVVDIGSGMMVLWTKNTFQDGSRVQGIETEVYVRTEKKSSP